MRADELRSLQIPLKDRYRETPGAALITLRAQGTLGEGVRCGIETGKALVVFQTLAHPPALSVSRNPASGGT